MIIGFLIIGIIIIAAFIPRIKLKNYFIFSAVILSSIYLFASPTIHDDMYRHYQMLERFKAVSWIDILFMRQGSYGDYLANLYIPRYLVFCIYTKIMSYFPRQLYVVFIAFLMYRIPLEFIFDESRGEYRKANLVYIFSYAFYLMSVDYLSISAIRNTFCAMLFCYFLYLEIIKGKNRYFCWAGYVLLCFLHSYALVLLVIRILLLITNKYTKIIVAMIAFAGYAFITTRGVFFQSVLARFRIGAFSNLIVTSLDKGLEYAAYTSDERYKLKYFALFVYAICLIFSVIYLKKSRDGRKGTDKYNKLAEFIIFAILFSIGSYAQFDTFTRGSFIVIPAIGILVSQCLDKAVLSQGSIRFRIVIRKEALLMLLAMAIMFSRFAYLMYMNYGYIDGWLGR